MRYLSLLLICCICLSCTKQAHHEAASEAVTAEIRIGLQQTYAALGNDTAQLDNKTGRNLIYRLSLHAEDEGDKLKEILDQAPEVAVRVRRYAQSTIAMVERQRKGYPIPSIFDTLLKMESLSKSQQVVLLAATARLLSESEAKASGPGLKR